MPIIPIKRKKQRKYKGLKVVNIDVKVRQMIKKRFDRQIKISRNMVIISKSVNNSTYVFSTFSDADTVWMLEKIKNKYLK